MSEPIKDGGPAFPGGITSQPKATDDCPPTQQGMTLRDWFAGKALTGMLSSGLAWAEPAWKNDDVASEWAYKCADAMLRRREVKP